MIVNLFTLSMLRIIGNSSGLFQLGQFGDSLLFLLVADVPYILDNLLR